MRRKVQPKHAARQARHDVYRQHIFEAAETVFAEKGFDVAKVQDIAQRVGLSMGTIYGVFPSKNDLLVAILDDRGAIILELVRKVAGQPGTALEALRALIEAYVDFFVAQPQFLRMHLRQGSSWVLGPINGADSRQQVWQEIHELQAGIFRRGIREGVFVDEDPDYLAKLFSAMDQVVLADWVAQGMKLDRDALVRRLYELVERAFGTVGAARARARRK